MRRPRSAKSATTQPAPQIRTSFTNALCRSLRSTHIRNCPLPWLKKAASVTHTAHGQRRPLAKPNPQRERLRLRVQPRDRLRKQQRRRQSERPRHNRQGVGRRFPKRNLLLNHLVLLSKLLLVS